MTDYEKYRGRCKELSQAAVDADPSLTLVRGWYWCPIWNREEEHWWCKRKDGSIYDPTVRQFPSMGCGEYKEFDGWTNCEFCRKRIHEDYIQMCGRFPVCSTKCALSLVGL